MSGADRVGGRLASLGSAMGNIGKGMTLGITAPIIGAGAMCVKLAADFETSMAKISTVAGASKQELASMKSDVLKASSEMGMSAKDFSAATYEALSSGISKADAVKFTKDAAVLAKGGFTSVTTATDVLTSTINAYGKSSKDATNISNQLIVAQNLGKTTVDEMAQSLGNVIPIASALGVKTEELFSSIAASTSQGIKTAEAITGIKGAMSNIIKPSKQARDAAALLGLQFDANSVKTKGWMGFMQDVKSKLEQSAPAYAAKLLEVNKLKAAIEGNTGASSKYAAVIDQEKAKITKLREEKKSLTSKDKERKSAIDSEIKSTQAHIKTMKDEEKQSKKGAGSTKALKKELKAKEKTLKILERTSKGPLSAFATMFGSIEGLNSVMSMTSSGGAKVYNDSMKQMKENTNAAEDAFNKMMDTPEEKFKKAKVQMQNLGITIGGYLLPHVVRFLNIFSKVLEILDKLPGPVKKSIVGLLGFAAVIGPILIISSKLITSVGTIMGVFKKLAGITKVVGIVVGAFKKLAGAARIFSMLPGLISPPVLIAVGVIAGLGLIIYEVIKHWAKLKGFFTKICGWIKNFFKKWGNQLLVIFVPVIGIPLLMSKHWGSLPKKISNVCKNISRVFKISIEGWKYSFSCLFKFMGKVGSWICDGLLGGLQKGLKKVTDASGKMAHGIKNAFKKVLDINSPSGVFDAYGGFIGIGLTNGLDKQDGAITAKFKGLGNKIKGLGNIRPDFSGLNSTALHGPAGIGRGNSGFGNVSNNSNKSTKQVNYNPNIKMYVTIADTGAVGTKQLTQEVKNMGDNAFKNGLIGDFMKDVTRSY